MKIGFIRKQLLRLLTKLQSLTLINNNDSAYLFLTEIHFMLFFRKKLKEEAYKNSREFRKASHRHACMVIDHIFHHCTDKSKDHLYFSIRESFHKNLILDLDL